MGVLHWAVMGLGSISVAAVTVSLSLAVSPLEVDPDLGPARTVVVDVDGSERPPTKESGDLRNEDVPRPSGLRTHPRDETPAVAEGEAERVDDRADAEEEAQDRARDAADRARDAAEDREDDEDGEDPTE